MIGFVSSFDYQLVLIFDHLFIVVKYIFECLVELHSGLLKKALANGVNPMVNPMVRKSG